MHNVRQVCEDTWWLGASDRRIELFENTYPVPDGMSYNNYLVLDESTCLLDGIDAAVQRQFEENLDFVLDGRPLDYLVVDHMEPDHCAVIPDLVRRWPHLKVVATAKAFTMMRQFYGIELGERAIVAKEGTTLSLGRHTLQFVMAPMVHWPEVMVTFDQLTGTLFSADAFGAFGATGGSIFADEVDWERDWADEARRYYTNIVGKYGPQVQALLKKAARLDIQTIAPLHAHIWRGDATPVLSRYAKWAAYEPEDDAVVVYYGSVYGNTANAADILAVRLAEAGVADVRVYDTSKTPVSELVSQAFRAKALVFATATYNMGIFDSMRTLLEDLAAHGMRDRVVGVVYNGTWAPAAGKQVAEALAAMRGMELLEPQVRIDSAVSEASLAQLQQLADAIVERLA